MTAVDELVAFVRQQLAEDERVAREVTELARFDEWDAAGSRVDDEIGRSNWEVVGIARPPSVPAAKAISQHIARWDPARVLAEVEAKRRILDLHAPLADYKGRVQCETVSLLAQPYAGRDGWREEWRA